MKKGDIPGLAILIIKDNKIFLNKGYGYANIEKAKVNPHTQFEIASNTKSFYRLCNSTTSSRRKNKFK